MLSVPHAVAKTPVQHVTSLLFKILIRNYICAHANALGRFHVIIRGFLVNDQEVFTGELNTVANVAGKKRLISLLVSS